MRCSYIVSGQAQISFFHLVYLRFHYYFVLFCHVQVATFSIRDTTGQVKTFRGDRMRHEQHPGQCESIDSFLFFSSFIALLLLIDSVASYLSLECAHAQ